MVGTILVAALMGLGCKKQEDAGKPSGVPPLDPGDAARRAGAGAGTGTGTGRQPCAPAAAAPGATISGEIVIPPAMAARKPSGTLYLVARRPSDNPSARGTLIAVKKLPATTFPLPFTLSAADMPFQTGAFDGEMQLSARIDRGRRSDEPAEGRPLRRAPQGSGRLARREGLPRSAPEGDRVARRRWRDAARPDPRHAPRTPVTLADLTNGPSVHVDVDVDVDVDVYLDANVDADVVAVVHLDAAGGYRPV